MKRIKKIIFRVLTLSAVFGLVLFVCGFWVIYKDVKTMCIRVKGIYQDNCVNSLMMYLQSGTGTNREKNSAVWALGQLADKNALPFLYELNKTLPEREKCAYDKYLCKYEAQKAIKWCERGNITSWMYRGL